MERTGRGTEGSRSAGRLPFSSGTHSIFPFLHRLDQKERERVVREHEKAMNEGLDKEPHKMITARRVIVTHQGPEALKVTSPGCDTPPME